MVSKGYSYLQVVNDKKKNDRNYLLKFSKNSFLHKKHFKSNILVWKVTRKRIESATEF